MRSEALRGVHWLLLPVLALWPLWLWSARRLSDGSDDPFGIVALVTLLAILWRERHGLQAAPRRGWLLGCVLLAALAGLTQGLLPTLPRAALAVLAVLAAAMSLREPRQPCLAWFGLGLLALPLLSSLQFYLGYPLRLVTAGASVWLLRGLGLAVTGQGTVLDVDGQLVMVDAPCSGIQMAWVAYFVAFAAAAWLRLADKVVLRRIPLLGVLVLLGNILRNGLLVLLETGYLSGPGWLHEGIGLAVFALLCLLVLRLVARPAASRPECATVPGQRSAALTLPVRGLLLAGFTLLGVWPLLSPRNSPPALPAAVEWPQQFAGRELRPLALSPIELRFAAQFPGAIGRFSDGQRVLSLRQVQRPTRLLHPAADCFRGLGYRIQSIALERRERGAGLQRCFVAEAAGERLRVCEYIEDAAGRSFSDHSAWYWSALAGGSQGPWLAVTTAQHAP